jgi:cell division protein FtsB
MSTVRWIAGGCVLLAVFAAAAWWLQRQEAEVLRGEIALLREERAELGKLRDENRRLAAQATAADEVARLRADRAAIGRLRAEIETLRATTETTARRVEGAKRGP